MQSNPAALHFADHFLRMVEGERFDPYQDGLSDDLERIACYYFEDVRPGFWYDGVSGMETSRRKPRQFRITGEMWVAEGGKTDQWLESFEALCTDKRLTKEGIWIQMRIGEYEAECDLFDLIAPQDLQLLGQTKQPNKPAHPTAGNAPV
jgi:hypothetical protein